MTSLQCARSVPVMPISSPDNDPPNVQETDMATYTHFETVSSPMWGGKSVYWGDIIGSAYSATPSVITIGNNNLFGTLTKALGSFVVLPNGNLIGGVISTLEHTSS